MKSITVKDFEILRRFNSANLMRSLQDLKIFADEKFGGLDRCFQQLLNLECRVAGRVNSISFKTFEKAFKQGGFKKAFPHVDLEMLFLFLDESNDNVIDENASGRLTYMEWQLLRGFEARAIAGSPSRLRRFLEKHYGDMEEAYKSMQAHWQARVVRERLIQSVLNGL